MRILKKGTAKKHTIFCQKLLFVFFSLLINSFFALAQSNTIDKIWQKWAAQHEPRKVEYFLNEVKGIKGQLEVNDLTYAINLAFNGPLNRNRPKELLVWHQLSGDMYLVHPNMQSNTLFHYQQALQLSEKLNNLPEKIATLLRIAELYRTLGLPERAYSFAIEAEKLCKDPRNKTKIPHVSDYLYKIADHYILVGKREHANSSFRLAIKINQFGSEYTNIYAYNNWGVNNVHMGRYLTALYLFDQGIAIAQRHNILIWVSIFKGNQGWTYFKMNQLDRAKPLIIYDLTTSAPIDSNNASRSAQLLAEIALKQGDPDGAFKMLEQASFLAPSIARTPPNIHLWASAHAMKQNWAEAYRYSILADEEEDRRTLNKTEQEKRLFNNLTHFLDQEGELEQRANQLAFEKKQARNRLFFLILVFLLSMGIGVFFFLRAKNLSLKNETQLSLELKELKKQVELYQNLLREQAPDPNLDLGFIQLQRNLEFNQNLQRTKLLTEHNWREFKYSFEQLYPGFLQKINTHAAQFTPAEVRLLTLFKLDLKGHEIAEILGISIDGVKKGKQRLKKKLLAYPEELELMTLIS